MKTCAHLRISQAPAPNVHNVLYNDTGSLEEEFDFYEGLPTDSSKPLMLKRKMKVVDVPRSDHFDKADDQYPEFATYILYGDVGNAYLFHSPTKDPDYLQVKLFGTKLKSFVINSWQSWIIVQT